MSIKKDRIQHSSRSCCAPSREALGVQGPEMPSLLEGVVDRRELFKLAAACGWGILVAGVSAHQLAATEPLVRPAPPRLKLSFAAYSYRDYFQSKTHPLSWHDFLRECAGMGFDAAELTSYYFPESWGEREFRDLSATCFRWGLDVSGMAIRNDFCHARGPLRQEELEKLQHWLRIASWLGAPFIRVFAGSPHEGQSEGAARAACIETLQRACDEFAGPLGIHLALENHGGITATAEGLLEIVRQVQSPWFGVNLDTGNFHSEDIYAELALLAPFALNVQCKVMVQQGNRPPESMDYRRLIRLLTAAGYRGYLSLEYEEAEDPRAACPRHVRELRATISAEMS
jgi:sugar phosphate isomerase/epimerase